MTDSPENVSASSSRARLEDVLDGRVVGGDAVAEVVDAARRPAEQSELAGLDAALTAFRSSYTAPADERRPARAPRRGIPVLRRLAAATLATQVAVGSAVAAAAGYVTVTTVEHYRQHRVPPPVTSTAPSTPGSRSPSDTSGARPQSPQPGSATPSTTPGPSGSSSPGQPSATRSGSTSSTPLVELCVQWRAQSTAGRTAHRATFVPLVSAAGGVSHVNAFCATLTSRSSGVPASSSPSTGTSSPSTGRASTAPSSVPSSTSTSP